MTNIDRDLQTFNDREYQMHQERLARINNFDEDLAQKTDALSKTVKQTRGVKLQSLETMHNTQANLSNSFQM